MNRRVGIFLALWGLAYAALSALYIAALWPCPLDLARFIWVTAGLISLGGPSADIATMAVFAGVCVRWPGRRESEVPLELTAEQLDALDSRAPKTAVIIPAHCEAATAEDARALAERVVGIVRNTPRWSTVYLVFDS